jgi:hypothetical protein
MPVKNTPAALVWETFSLKDCMERLGYVCLRLAISRRIKPGMVTDAAAVVAAAAIEVVGCCTSVSRHLPLRAVGYAHQRDVSTQLRAYTPP